MKSFFKSTRVLLVLLLGSAVLALLQFGIEKRRDARVGNFLNKAYADLPGGGGEGGAGFSESAGCASDYGCEAGAGGPGGAGAGAGGGASGGPSCEAAGGGGE